MDAGRPSPIGFSGEKASRALEKHGIDVLVASTPVNVFYTTGMPTLHVAPNPILYVLRNQFPTLSLVRRDGAECAFTWLVYQSTAKWTWVDDVVGTLSPKQTMDELGEKIRAWGLAEKTIGVESLMPKYQYDFLRETFPQAKIVDGDGAFLEMRIVKTAEEIRRIRESTEIAEKAILAVIEAAREGVTDKELLRAARRTIIEEGAEGWDHLTLGLGESDPEAPGLGYVVKAGEINRIDIGVVYQGYISDVSREFCVGEPPEGAREHMDLVIKVQDYVAERVRPGVNAKALFKEAKAYAKSLSRAGMIYITTHSLGLECEEVHLFSPMRSLDAPFEEGMVVDIEVWKTFKNFNLVGIEDCYRVTGTGVEKLSSLDRGLFVR